MQRGRAVDVGHMQSWRVGSRGPQHVHREAPTGPLFSMSAIYTIADQAIGDSDRERERVPPERPAQADGLAGRRDQMHLSRLHSKLGHDSSSGSGSSPRGSDE